MDRPPPHIVHQLEQITAMYRDTAPVVAATIEAYERTGLSRFEALCFGLAAFEQITTDAHDALRQNHEGKR